MTYCPWCGAPIPDELHTVQEGAATLFEHKIICIRCNEVSYFRDGWRASDKEISELLFKEEEE